MFTVSDFAKYEITVFCFFQKVVAIAYNRPYTYLYYTFKLIILGLSNAI